MAKKEFKYKGYTMKELEEMKADDVVKLLPSRVRRNLKRGLGVVHKNLIIEIKEAKKADPEWKSQKPIKTHLRDMPILPEMVGAKVSVYNGKEFSEVSINPEMIGHYLGEYVQTRKVVKHSAPGIGATRSSLFVPIR